ncbi:hypothetical protein V8D89_001745 [Ganoderma adspersum]
MILAASLPFDVLAIVCEFLTNTSDVSSFSLICSSLRPVATRRLLSMRPISLTGGSSVLRFHSFLFADTPARAPRVRALHIDSYSEEESESPDQVWDQLVDTSLLVDILTSCPRIECIFIAFDSSLHATTGDGPCIIRATASLSTLRSLSLYGQPADANRLLHARRAPLRVLALHSTPARGDHWNPASLARHIFHLAPALEERNLGQFTVDPDEIHAMQNPPPDSRTALLRCTALRSLAVEFFHLFPTLDRTFSVFHGPFTTFKTPEDKYVRLRAANRRAQESGGAWTKLDRVACDALVFYVLSLRCPVRLAMLDVAPGKGSAFTSHYAAAALREHPGPRLKLSLMLDNGLGAMFDGLFDAPAVPEALTHLTLRGDSGGRWPAAVPQARLGSALTPLRNLAHLRVVVHSNAVENENAGDAVAFARTLRRCRPTSEPSSDEGAGAGAGAGEDAAAVLVRALPSLQYVFLTVSGYLPDPEDMRAEGGFYPEEEVWEFRFERWRASQAWRVTKLHPDANSNGKGSARELDVTRLHNDVAETIIQMEELVLSRKDEAWLYTTLYE